MATFTRLLAKRYKGRLDADADEFIRSAVDGAERMQQLIRDLLVYSHLGAHRQRIDVVDLEALLRRVKGDLGPAIIESHATITHDPMPSILADGTQLGQVFQNLIANALKFHGQKPPRVHISALRQSDGWMFSVRDNGIGIEPQYRSKIFDVFQRLHTREQYPGTGIGLAICKKVVETHGGRIWVESEPGRGSTFYLTIPASRWEAALGKNGLAPEAKAALTTKPQ